MPAGLPGDTPANNAGNPSTGRFVTFDPLSGPKGSPLDAKKIDYTTGSPLGWHATNRVPIVVNDTANVSTGALSTGIGMSPAVTNINTSIIPATPPQAIYEHGFEDNYAPGTQGLGRTGPPSAVTSEEVDSSYLYIGGGRDLFNTGTAPTDKGKPSVPVPYNAGVMIAGAGNGGSRDGGGGTGFGMRMVTAIGTVANGVVVETGYVNRTGVVLALDQSTFGSGSAALAFPAGPGLPSGGGGGGDLPFSFDSTLLTFDSTLQTFDATA